MVRKHMPSLLACIAILLSLCALSLAIDDVVRDSTTYGDVTREQILETRNRRKRQLNAMVMDYRKKLAEHSTGKNILTAKQKEELENKVDLFQRKIESMEVELEDWVRARTFCLGKMRFFQPRSFRKAVMCKTTI